MKKMCFICRLINTLIYFTESIFSNKVLVYADALGEAGVDVQRDDAE